MKKALSLMTAAALVLSLAACGSTASSAASSEAASPEAASSDAASSEAASSEAASETETAELSTVEPGKLIMSTNAAFPPYEMTTDSGEFEGIDIETAQAIADKLGLELQIDDMDFDAALLAVQQGKSDMVMAGVTWMTWLARKSAPSAVPPATCTALTTLAMRTLLLTTTA